MVNPVRTFSRGRNTTRQNYATFLFRDMLLQTMTPPTGMADFSPIYPTSGTRSDIQNNAHMTAIWRFLSKVLATWELVARCLLLHYPA
jgi:hypothetical protein